MIFKIVKKLLRLISDNFFTTFVIPYVLFAFGRPEKICKIVFGRNDSIVTNKLFFPKKSDIFMQHKSPEMGVCMQGKITSVTELLCFFRAIKICESKNIEFVLSTWEHQFLNRVIMAFSTYGRAKVLFNERPRHAGMQNVNLQMVSTTKGIDATRSKKVLKLRTDHWICHPSLFSIFDLFSKENDVVVGASDLGSNYGYRDQFIYSDRENLIKIFDNSISNTEGLSGSIEEILFAQIKNEASYKIIDISLLPLIWCKYPRERLYGSSNNKTKLQLSLWI